MNSSFYITVATALAVALFCVLGFLVYKKPRPVEPSSSLISSPPSRPSSKVEESFLSLITRSREASQSVLSSFERLRNQRSPLFCSRRTTLRLAGVSTSWWRL
ncbi:unnamed protein product [Brassica napus]|uniref:(rape) hypothetical protein n=1 Tax=Brassica napus TaxID=3708 RepID=A0A816P108_BRANA|nr:unnamed protein product [Brassica napus]